MTYTETLWFLFFISIPVHFVLAVLIRIYFEKRDERRDFERMMRDCSTRGLADHVEIFKEVKKEPKND